MERGTYIKKTEQLIVYSKKDGEIEKKQIIESNVYVMSDKTSFVKYKVKNI